MKEHHTYGIVVSIFVVDFEWCPWQSTICADVCTLFYVLYMLYVRTLLYCICLLYLTKQFSSHSYCRDSSKSPNKLVLFSRSSPLVHALPTQFPCLVRETLEDLAIITANVKELIFEDTDKLVVHKLSGLLSQSSVQELLRDFVNSENAEVLLLLANMQDTSTKTINHIRIMIEEAELQAPRRQNNPVKLFVLLLHFPPALFFKHCYPALFLKSWDHMYLDTITHSSSVGVVDIQDWFQRCCFPTAAATDDTSTSTTTDQPDQPDQPDPLLSATTHLLPQAISVLSAHMYFGNKKDKSFNSSMNATQRGEALRGLLGECGLGKVLCEKFCSYWKPKVMLEYLKRAATFSKQRESTLNITDSIQTQFKSLFLDFCIYMLSRANEHYNLDIVFEEKEDVSPVKTLFLDIFQLFPVPKLNQLSLLSTSLPPPQPPLHQPHFPFFSFVCGQVEKQVETSCEAANLKVDVLADREEPGVTSFSANAMETTSSNPEAKLKALVTAVLADIEPLLEVSRLQSHITVI